VHTLVIFMLFNDAVSTVDAISFVLSKRDLNQRNLSPSYRSPNKQPSHKTIMNVRLDVGYTSRQSSRCLNIRPGFERGTL
jgi:hypothetical protein